MKSERVRREMAADLEAHLAERADELMERGMSEAEARQRARRELGNQTLLVETGGDVWSWHWLETAVKDLRYAWRALRAAPLFTVTAVVSLALGIGANTAIYTLLYAALWKPLPVPEPGRIFQLWRHADSGPWIGDFGDSYVLFQQLAASGRPVGELFAESSFGADQFATDGGARERIAGEAVSGNFFSALGVTPFLGRVLESQDDSVLGGKRVAVLSHAFWARRFQADPAILGKTIRYIDVPYTVVGVAQRGFTGTEAEAAIDMWVPVTSCVDKKWLTSAYTNWLRVLVRLRPGASPSQAQALFESTFRLHVADKLMPEADAHWKAVLAAQRVTLRPAYGGLATTGHKYENALLMMLVLVALVLLISCANVANLMMARNSARQQEIAIRRALGAGRLRIAGQLFTESLLVSVASAALGLMLAAWGARLLIALLPQPEVPLAFDLHPGLAVLAFTAAIAIATAVLFGLGPAWRAGSTDADVGLRFTPRITRDSLTGRLLVAGQLALSVVLVIGAGLFISTLRNLKTTDLGFRPEHVYTFDLAFPKGTPDTRIRQTYAHLQERLESHHGVAMASFAWPTIYGRGGWSGAVEVEGHQSPPGEDNEVGMIAAGPRFFETVGMSLLQGRFLRAQDQTDSPPVALVNESFARYYFGESPAIGRRFEMRGSAKTVRTIVGIVRDARHYGVREKVERMVYLPASESPHGSFYVRADADAASLRDLVRAEVAAIDKTAEFEAVHPFATTVNDMISQERLTATLSALFGVLALLLAAVGLYGVVAYGVSRRTREFGVRLALGAQRGDVQRLVLRQTLPLVGAGIAAGVVTAFSLARLLSMALSGMLYGIRPENAKVFGEAVVLLAAIALIASFLPARRAARIDPIISLRYE